MRTAFITLGLFWLTVAAFSATPAALFSGSVLLTAGVLGGREADYADEA